MTDDAELKKAGLKVTLPRLRILELLEEDQAHLSAEDIYRKLIDAGEEVGLATVYRVLTPVSYTHLTLPTTPYV